MTSHASILDKQKLYNYILLFMRAGTFLCHNCKIIFQLIGISSTKNPRYCTYCGAESLQGNNIIFACIWISIKL